MTTNRLTPLLAALFVTATLLAGVAPAAAASPTDPQYSLQADADPTDAALSIRQPHYIDEDVRERSENGTQVYLAQGAELVVTPTNFDAANVTDARTTTDGGTLTYDDTLERYVFRPDGGEGSYALEWTVEREESVTVAGENNTTTTEVQSVTETYAATLRVDGGLDMQHLSAAESAERDHYLELGREVNATADEIREANLPTAKNSGDDYAIFQAMTNRYVNTGNPVNLLSGNIGLVLTTLVMTMGGWLLLVVAFGSVGNAIRALRKKLHIHESVEHEEGEIADRQADIEVDARNRALQNVDLNDWFEDDAVAGWMREAGENAHDVLQTLTSGELEPERWVADRLYVMGAAGYQADVTRAESPVTDGGEPDDSEADAEDDAEGEIVAVRLAAPDAEDDGLEPLADLDLGQLVAAVSWDDRVMWDEFSLPDADVDFESLEREPLTMDLDAVLAEANLEVERFPNKRVAGQCIMELVESVAEHEYTDTSGRPQAVRELMNNLLKGLQQASDRHRMPVGGISEAVEQGLINHDPNAEARQAAREVQAGAD